MSGSIGRIGISAGLWVDVTMITTAAAMSRGANVSWRSPTSGTHVRAARGAARRLAVLDARFQSVRREGPAVSVGMRRRTHTGGEGGLRSDDRGARVQIVAHVGRQRTVAIVGVVHTIGTLHLGTW